MPKVESSTFSVMPLIRNTQTFIVQIKIILFVCKYLFFIEFIAYTFTLHWHISISNYIIRVRAHFHI